MTRSLVARLLVGSALTIGVAGCGASGGHAAPSPADRERARAVMALYQAFPDVSVIDAWAIRSVTVSGGDVTVHTDLWPKSENRPQFLGACTELRDAFPWIESVAVEGVDDLAHATWVQGALVCSIAGL
jgi:hypothetical protein